MSWITRALTRSMRSRSTASRSSDRILSGLTPGSNCSATRIASVSSVAGCQPRLVQIARTACVLSAARISDGLTSQPSLLETLRAGDCGCRRHEHAVASDDRSGNLAVRSLDEHWHASALWPFGGRRSQQTAKQGSLCVPAAPIGRALEPLDPLSTHGIRHSRPRVEGKQSTGPNRRRPLLFRLSIARPRSR